MIRRLVCRQRDQAAQPADAVMGEDLLAPAQVKNDLERIRRDLTLTLSSQIARTRSLSRWAATDW